MNENQSREETGVSSPSKKRLSRKWRFGSVAVATTAVVVAVVLLLNVVMDAVEKRFPLTVDLTADGTYTLSEESIALAKGIAEPVDIVVFTAESFFASPNTGADMMDVVLTQFYQTVKQYQAQSGGKVTTRFIDLDANPTLANQYADYGVEGGSILFLCGERYQTITLMDLYDYDGSYYEGYTYTSEVERVVASKINLVSAAVVKHAVMLTGHGEAEEVIETLSALLAANGCEVETLDITASSEPPEQVDVFIIAGATSDYATEEITKLRGWLDNGGKRERDLLVLLDPATVQKNLNEMLADEFGIVVQDRLVSETDTDNVYNMVAYNTYANVAETDYTQDLTDKRVLIPMARPLTLTLTESTDESKFSKPLVTFGDTARVQDLSQIGTSEDEAAEAVKAESYPLVAAAYTTDRLYDNNDNRYYTTDVMVFGSVMFCYETVFNVTSAVNEEVFLNTFRGLTGLESVISVSNRSLSQETLDFGGSKVPAVLGIGVFTAGVPAAMIVLAIVVFVRRRRL